MTKDLSTNQVNRTFKALGDKLAAEGCQHGHNKTP
jgi:hypothetical protein